MESLPFDVMKLMTDSLGDRVLQQIEQSPHERPAADDPEHVEAAQRVDRDDATVVARPGSPFFHTFLLRTQDHQPSAAHQRRVATWRASR